MIQARRRRTRIHDFHPLEDRTLLTTLIALVDSGVDLTDQSLLPYLDLSAGYDAYNKVSVAAGGSQTVQDTSLQHGHGSVVADMIVQGIRDASAAAGNASIDVKILPIRDTSSNLNIDTNALIRGIYYAADQGASVINLSVNSYYNPSLYDPSSPYNGASLVQAIQYAETKGAVVVTAPGNGSSNIDLIPVFPPYADDPAYSTYRPTPTNVLVAAAVDAQGQLTSASNWGPIHVDLGAYAGPEGYTSYSAGYASGVAGVVSELMSPGRTARSVIDVLDQTVTPHAQTVGAWSVTGGVLNPAAAVARALQPVQTAPSPPPGEDPGPDLALNAQVFSSTIENTAYNPQAAVDGNSSTRWSSGQWMQDTTTGWITVDLGDLYNVTDVRMNWERAYAVDYQIQVSPDDVNWTTIRSVTGRSAAGVDDQSGLSGIGRYVRIYCTQMNATDNYSLYDLNIYGTSLNDLAAGKPASSSSVEGAAYLPANAVDANSVSRWSSGQWMQNTQTGWFRVDLGAVSQIGGVRLNWETAYAVDYQIQASTNGTDWTTLATITGNSQAGVVAFDGLTGVGRYLRIYCTQTSATSINYSLYDVKVYGTPLTNLAAGKSSTSSSVEGPGFEAASAVDSNPATRWSSGQWMQNTQTGWIAVDLGAQYTINEVRLNWETAYAADYQIQTSDDGVNWTTIRAVDGRSAPGGDDQTGLSGVGRFIRIYCTQTSATADNYSLYDLKVYGSPAPAVAGQAPAGSSPIAQAPLTTGKASVIKRAPVGGMLNQSRPQPSAWAFTRPTRPLPRFR